MSDPSNLPSRQLKRAVALVAFYQPDVLDGRPYPTIVGCIDADTIEAVRSYFRDQKETR